MLGIQWALVLFTAVGGAGSICFLFLCINEFLGRVKKQRTVLVTCVVAFVLLVVGGAISVTHVIHHLDRVPAVFAHPAEGIFEEALLIGINCALVALYFLFILRGVGLLPRRIVAVLGIGIGLFFPYACGHSYMMDAQLTWNTITLPIGYMGTVLPSGAAIWALLTGLFKEDDKARATCGYELVAASIVSLVLGSLYAFVSGSAFNDQALLFWVGIFLLAGIVPLVGGLAIVLRTRCSGELPVQAVLVVCTLVGASCYRILMWTGADVVMALFGALVE